MQVGDLIAGRFRLEARAGAGAMGEVFRARVQGGGDCDWVAIKAFRSDNTSSSERFLREASALARVRDPAIVQHIQHGISEAGEPYLAMEWIEGPTLSERLAGRGLTPLETLALGRRILHGLAALHANGIVHRDLKPSNLMLPGDDAREARILDLGVARIADASVDLTLAGTQLGTPRYMAPEQIRDPRRVDGRADVFALGAVLFECLTGLPALPGDDPVAIVAQIMFGQPVDVSELRAELPEELDRLISRMLVRRPELRPDAGPELQQSFAELLAAPFSERLAELAAAPALPAQAAALATALAERTLPELSGERISAVPPLLGRALEPLHDVLADTVTVGLIGRDRELGELLGWFAEVRPVTLWGGPGVGKTRLALELAKRAVAQGIVSDKAVLFCDLSAARDSRDVVRISAAQLGVTHAGDDAEDRLGRLFRKLGEVLIILDRAEHLTRELEPLIQLWTSHAPALRVLVTSRVRLRSTREYALGPLAHRGHSLPLRAASQPPLASQPTAAAELVLTLARAGFPELLAQPGVAQQAEAIASALDGNPLAIQLALARLPLLGFQGIVERLPAQLSLLAEQSSATTMRRAIEWSWQLLKPAERSVFMQCSVFCAPFSSAAAERVVVLPPELGAVLDVLQSLREQSLLSSRAEGGTPGQMRLTMPAVVREFSREQLARASDPALQAVAERHAEYCASADAKQLDVEEAVAAAEFSLSQRGFELRRALRLLLGLERPLLAAGIGSPLFRLLEQALEAEPGAGDSALRLRAFQLRARLLAPAGELARAKRDLEHVLAEAAQHEDAALRGTALLDLGVVHHFARDLEAARGNYREALDVLYDADDAVAEARCHGNLGAVDHDQARLFEAAEGYRRALALLPEQGQDRLVANFQSNLALVEHELGRTQAARALYAAAALRLEALLDARLLGIVLGNFGTLALAEDKLAEALEHFQRAAALLEQSGDRRSEGLSLARLAVGLVLNGRVQEAEQRAARAERLLRKDAIGRAVAALLSAFIDLQTAERAIEQAQVPAARNAWERAEAKRKAALPQREGADDLRLYLALLEPRIAEVAGRLKPAAELA